MSKENNHVNRTLAIIIIASFCLLALAFGMSHPRKRDVPVSADGGSIFMSYDGPIFPLTSREAVPWIEVSREIELDFSGYDNAEQKHQRIRECKVYDRYTLTNTSDENQTLTIMYPYLSSFLC